ncbi:MAG TPA: hypothetical protein VF391_12795 [Dermatophilaceae bacterium]
MTPRPDRPRRTSAVPGAASRDAGLTRVRTVTKAAGFSAAAGSVALGLVFAIPARSQTTSSAPAPAPGLSSNQQAPVAAPPPPPAAGVSQDRQQLAPPPQAPAAMAPQAQPQAVSGGS